MLSRNLESIRPQIPDELLPWTLILWMVGHSDIHKWGDVVAFREGEEWISISSIANYHVTCSTEISMLDISRISKKCLAQLSGFVRTLKASVFRTTTFLGGCFTKLTKFSPYTGTLTHEPPAEAQERNPDLMSQKWVIFSISGKRCNFFCFLELQAKN